MNMLARCTVNIDKRKTDWRFYCIPKLHKPYNVRSYTYTRLNNTFTIDTTVLNFVFYN